MAVVGWNFLKKRRRQPTVFSGRVNLIFQFLSNGNIAAGKTVVNTVGDGSCLEIPPVADRAMEARNIKMLGRYNYDTALFKFQISRVNFHRVVTFFNGYIHRSWAGLGSNNVTAVDMNVGIGELNLVFLLVGAGCVETWGKKTFWNEGLPLDSHLLICYHLFQEFYFLSLL